MKQYFGQTNGKGTRCIDGRGAILIMEWDGSKWIISKRGGEAANEHGPQFLGGGLMFVKALQVHAGMELEEAFEAVEKALRALGFIPQIHIDDHHGQYEFLSMNDKEVIDVILNQYVLGCGYAVHAWGDEAEAVLKMALARHWRVQVLTKDHIEDGATINNGLGTTYFSSVALSLGQSRFNIDYAEAILVLVELMNNEFFDELSAPRFVLDGMKWVYDQYVEVVIKLGGVKTASDIITL